MFRSTVVALPSPADSPLVCLLLTQVIALAALAAIGAYMLYQRKGEKGPLNPISKGAAEIKETADHVKRAVDNTKDEVTAAAKQQRR